MRDGSESDGPVGRPRARGMVYCCVISRSAFEQSSCSDSLTCRRAHKSITALSSRLQVCCAHAWITCRRSSQRDRKLDANAGISGSSATFGVIRGHSARVPPLFSRAARPHRLQPEHPLADATVSGPRDGIATARAHTRAGSPRTRTWLGPWPCVCDACVVAVRNGEPCMLQHWVHDRMF